MFRFNLAIIFSGSKIVIRPALILRLALVLITLAMIFVTIYYSPSLSSIMITVICFIAALYEERWTFDLDKKTMQRKTGLVFPSYKKTWSFEQINSLEVQTFAKGRLFSPAHSLGMKDQSRSQMRRYYIELADSSTLPIEILPKRENDPFFANYKKLAQQINIQLIEK